MWYLVKVCLWLVLIGVDMLPLCLPRVAMPCTWSKIYSSDPFIFYTLVLVLNAKSNRNWTSQRANNLKRIIATQHAGQTSSLETAPRHCNFNGSTPDWITPEIVFEIQMFLLRKEVQNNNEGHCVPHKPPINPTIRLSAKLLASSRRGFPVKWDNILVRLKANIIYIVMRRKPIIYAKTLLLYISMKKPFSCTCFIQ